MSLGTHLWLSFVLVLYVLPLFKPPSKDPVFKVMDLLLGLFLLGAGVRSLVEGDYEYAGYALVMSALSFYHWWRAGGGDDFRKRRRRVSALVRAKFRKIQSFKPRALAPAPALG